MRFIGYVSSRARRGFSPYLYVTDGRGRVLIPRMEDDPSRAFVAEDLQLEVTPALAFLPHGRILAGAHEGIGLSFYGELLPGKFRGDFDEAWERAEEIARVLFERRVMEEEIPPLEKRGA